MNVKSVKKEEVFYDNTNIVNTEEVFIQRIGIVKAGRAGAYVRPMPAQDPSIRVVKDGEKFPIIKTPDEIGMNWYKIALSAERHPGGKYIEGYIRADLFEEIIDNNPVIKPEG